MSIPQSLEIGSTPFRSSLSLENGHFGFAVLPCIVPPHEFLIRGGLNELGGRVRNSYLTLASRCKRWRGSLSLTPFTTSLQSRTKPLASRLKHVIDTVVVQSLMIVLKLQLT
ncbi:hypothetical protein Tco_1038898, partial [Tanacetum coccineum]